MLVSKKTNVFTLDKTDTSRYQQILDLTLFHKSKDLPLDSFDLKFDPIYDNMVFMMKYTIVLLEKVRLFLETRHHDKDYVENGQSNKYQADLRHHERKQVKTIVYRAVYYMSQIRNYLLSIIQKNILTPKLFLLYNKERPGQFHTLTDMQTEINSLKFEEFIKMNRDRLKYIGVFFKKNMMKILTMRMFKRVLSSRYLQSTILLAMGYFSNDYTMRTAICEFFYYYNFLIDLFYLYMPKYITNDYKLAKQDLEGSEMAIHTVTPGLESSELPNVIRWGVPKQTHEELVKIEKRLGTQGLLLGVGKGLLGKLKKNLMHNSNFMEGEGKEGEIEKANKQEQKYLKMYNKTMSDQKILGEMDIKAQLDETLKNGFSPKMKGKESSAPNLENEDGDNLLNAESDTRSNLDTDGNPLNDEENISADASDLSDDQTPDQQQDDLQEELLGELEQRDESLLKKELETLEQELELNREMERADNPVLLAKISEVKGKLGESEEEMLERQKYMKDHSKEVLKEDELTAENDKAIAGKDSMMNTGNFNDLLKKLNKGKDPSKEDDQDRHLKRFV